MSPVGIHIDSANNRRGRCEKLCRTNIFVALVGETSKGRKGTSWGRVRQIMAVAAPNWTNARIHSGLSSGEGLIWAVRDPIMGIDKRGKRAGGAQAEVEIDRGVSDKRLLICTARRAPRNRC